MEPVTLAQRYFFEAQGYLVVENALDRDELARVRAACDAAEALWRSDLSRPGVRRPDLEQVTAILEYDPIFFEIFAQPRMVRLVSELLGPDLTLLDHDYFITPPGAEIRQGWHYDENFPGVDHPHSHLMLKVFYVLDDIAPDGGATLILPGSNRFPYTPVNPEVPEDMPAAVSMALPAGSAYLMAGRAFHSAGDNHTDRHRRLLIYNYGHKWMRVWDGYAPSPALQALATTPFRRQLLGLTDPYGPNAPLDEVAA